MNNQSDVISNALAAAGLPPLTKLAETYSVRCFEQFEPLFLSGVDPLVVCAVALEALMSLTASMLLTLQVNFPGIDSTGKGLEAFILDLRDTVARGPKTMEEIKRLEEGMEER